MSTARLLAAALLPLVLSSPRTGDAIVWETTYDGARERAREEGRVLVVAVHLVGEVATERTLAKVYTDDTVVELMARTVNLGTSNAYQIGDEAFLARFGGPTLEQARATDVAVRRDVLVPAEDGSVVAPQHVFLAPDGTALLSVAYEITAPELEWCLVEALERVDPETDAKRSARARAPRRLVLDGVASEGSTPPPPRPPDKAELEELLRRVDDLAGPELLAALQRLATSDDRRAVKQVADVLRNARNEGAGKGPSKRTLLRNVGELSPEPYWEMVEAELKNKGVAVRNEAAVALEQIGAAAAETALLKWVEREKDPRVRKNLARALGASGYDSAKARRELERVARKDEDPLVRVNAVLAMGRLTPHDDVREFLLATLVEGDDRARAAALLAMAWARDSYWRDVLPLLAAGEAVAPELARPLAVDDLADGARALSAGGERSAPALAAALAVLAGESLERLAPLVADVGGDTLPRRRLFATSTGEGPDAGDR